MSDVLKVDVTVTPRSFMESSEDSAVSATRVKDRGGEAMTMNIAR